jgi:hypothetical protein
MEILMCHCDKTCPKCDPGIDAFYQQKVKKAKAAADYLNSIGNTIHYEDLLDAKDIWYEYCKLRDEEAADEAADDQDKTKWTY